LTTMVNNFTSSLSGTVPASGGGTTNFLRADGTWTAIAVPAGSNPTASVGLTAVNGTATTYMRSDGAPALSQAIAPTWTGKHVFTGGLLSTSSIAIPSNVTGFYANGGNSGQYSQVNSASLTDAKIWDCYVDTGGVMHYRVINDAASAATDYMTVSRTGATGANIGIGGNTTMTGVPGTWALTVSSAASGTQQGLSILAGATSADVALDVANHAGSVELLKVFGDGSIKLGGVATTTTAPTPGTAAALPALPAGYLTITIGSRVSKIAYY
jgi:hypothetical protein